jgi:hypothetical protein
MKYSSHSSLQNSIAIDYQCVTALHHDQSVRHYATASSNLNRRLCLVILLADNYPDDFGFLMGGADNNMFEANTAQRQPCRRALPWAPPTATKYKAIPLTLTAKVLLSVIALRPKTGGPAQRSRFPIRKPARSCFTRMAKHTLKRSESRTRPACRPASAL